MQINGLSNPLSAKIEGTKITVTAAANPKNSVESQTLKISIEGGNEIEVPITIAAKPSGNETIINLDLTTADNYPDNFPVGSKEKKKLYSNLENMNIQSHLPLPEDIIK